MDCQIGPDKQSWRDNKTSVPASSLANPQGVAAGELSSPHDTPVKLPAIVLHVTRGFAPDER